MRKVPLWAQGLARGLQTGLEPRNPRWAPWRSVVCILRLLRSVGEGRHTERVQSRQAPRPFPPRSAPPQTRNQLLGCGCWDRRNEVITERNARWSLLTAGLGSCHGDCPICLRASGLWGKRESLLSGCCNSCFIHPARVSACVRLALDTQMCSAWSPGRIWRGRQSSAWESATSP